MTDELNNYEIRLVKVSRVMLKPGSLEYGFDMKLNSISITFTKIVFFFTGFSSPVSNVTCYGRVVFNLP